MTSGICQPPVHAIAARRVYEAATAPEGRQLLRDLFEPLRRWHAYLFEQRRIDSELIEIWHPWESGMDNSPLWDRPLANVRVEPDVLPPYRRVDTSLVDPSDRPTDAEYDTYMSLVATLRREHYAPAVPADHPFRVRDVLFNAALVRAERDLALIADVLGEDGSHERQRAASLVDAIDRELWSDDLGMHLSFDAVADCRIHVAVAGGLVALLAEPESSHRRRMIETLAGRFLQPGPGNSVLMTTVPTTDPAFEPTRYWRGPVWIQMSWLVIKGLELAGETDLAGRIRHGVIGLIEQAGFAEYFDPMTRVACGAQDFSWSASLLIDLLARYPD
jgi:hypothetical protein